MDNLQVGANEVKLDVNESIQEISQNKTLFIEQLTEEEPFTPEIVHDLKTSEEVFEHYQPKVEMTFEDSEGVEVKEMLHFRNLGDFGPKGITAQSEFLNNLSIEQEQYAKIIKQLQTNKALQAALKDPEAKAALLGTIKSLIQELG